jgi:hypothetical protein
LIQALNVKDISYFLQSNSKSIETIVDILRSLPGVNEIETDARKGERWWTMDILIAQQGAIKNVPQLNTLNPHP